MIEDCAHVIGATWKGKHSGTWGDVGCFSFQQGKHICTGDGSVMTTNRADLHHKLYNEWAFKGESPSLLTLNFRMNEVTAAVGLRMRTVPKAAVQSGYIWGCLWEGDKHGLSYARFKALAREEGVPFYYNFTERPAPTFKVFRQSSAYHVDDCPVRCPFYKGSYRIEEAHLPVAEEILKRIMLLGCVEVPPAVAKKRAAAIKRIVRKMES